jgi:hypothetical protein
MLMPVMARSAGIETDTGLLSPPMVDNKPVNVKTGLFLTNLIDVDEVKETFRISGYFFMTWKDPRLVFSPAGGERIDRTSPTASGFHMSSWLTPPPNARKPTSTSKVTLTEPSTISNCSRRNSPPPSIWNLSHLNLPRVGGHPG